MSGAAWLRQPPEIRAVCAQLANERSSFCKVKLVTEKDRSVFSQARHFLRFTKPTRARPPSSSAQVPGSGTAATRSVMSFAW